MSVPTQRNPDRKARISKIPWKSFLANLAVVGAAHGAGYLASGATSNVLARTPLVREQWHKLTPRTQRAVATGLIGATGAAIPLTIMATQLATHKNLQDAETRQAQNSKVASVIMTYQVALELE